MLGRTKSWRRFIDFSPAQNLTLAPISGPCRTRSTLWLLPVFVLTAPDSRIANGLQDPDADGALANCPNGAHARRAGALAAERRRAAVGPGHDLGAARPCVRIDAQDGLPMAMRPDAHAT